MGKRDLQTTLGYVMAQLSGAIVAMFGRFGWDRICKIELRPAPRSCSIGALMRPAFTAAANTAWSRPSPTDPHLGLPGHLQRVIHLDPQVSQCVVRRSRDNGFGWNSYPRNP